MKFSSLKEQSQKPKPLMRNLNASSLRKFKPALYEGVALGISVDSYCAADGDVNSCQFCEKSVPNSEDDKGCQNTFKDVHREADTITNLILKRFDHEKI